MRRRLLGVATLAVVGTLLPAAQAPAQAELGACEGKALRGAECGSIGVPLDHDSSTPPPAGPGLTLSFARFPAQGEERRGTIVFLAGGPGEAAIRGAGALARGPLESLRDDYDLVFVDQRGTGRSSPLRCSTARRGVFRASLTARRRAAAIAQCAAELGDARRFYSTYETVRDLEDLRAALGVEKIIPLGVSYGGQVAGDYARRYPERTEALVLDSSSPVEGIDTMSRLPQLGLARVFREACFPPGCNELIGRPTRLMGEAAARLDRRPLRARIGNRRVRLTGEDVYSLVMASDQDALLRAELPAVLQAAIKGDALPLARLVGYASSGSSGGINEVRFLATSCIEGNQPWDPASDPASREALLEQTLIDRRADYAPFPVDVVAGQLGATECLSWPSTPKPPVAPATSSGPDLPVLVLGGREDLRTPLEDQRRTAQQFPSAQLVSIKNTGHSVLTSDVSGCGEKALRRFLMRQEIGNCREGAKEYELALPYLRSLSRVPRASGSLPEVIERTSTAVDLTLRDAARWSATGAGSTARSIVPGLRGGRLVASPRALRLVNYQLVPGVRVSGTLSLRSGTGTLVVTGRSAAAGTLRVLRSGRMIGRLGGRIVRYRPLAVVGA